MVARIVAGLATLAAAIAAHDPLTVRATDRITTVEKAAANLADGDRENLAEDFRRKPITAELAKLRERVDALPQQHADVQELTPILPEHVKD